MIPPNFLPFPLTCAVAAVNQGEKEPHLSALTDAQYQHPRRRQLDGRLALISDALAGLFLGRVVRGPRGKWVSSRIVCQKWRVKVNNVGASENLESETNEFQTEQIGGNNSNKIRYKYQFLLAASAESGSWCQINLRP